MTSEEIRTVSSVCHQWQVNVNNNFAEVLILSQEGCMEDALCLALENNKDELAYTLVSMSSSPNQSERALRYLIRQRGGNGMSMDLINRLLDHPQHPACADCNDGTLLRDAAEGGHMEIVRMLLEAPQNAALADCRFGEFLVHAAFGGHTEIVRLLLEAPQNAASADCQNGEALRLAACGGHTEIVRLLLDAPRNAARADCQDGMALQMAALFGHTVVVKLLLNSPHMRVCHGHLALLRAKEGRHSDIVSLISQSLLLLQ